MANNNINWNLTETAIELKVNDEIFATLECRITEDDLIPSAWIKNLTFTKGDDNLTEEDCNLWSEAVKSFRDYLISEGIEYCEYECGDLEGNPFRSGYWNEESFAGKSYIIVMDLETERKYHAPHRARRAD